MKAAVQNSDGTFTQDCTFTKVNTCNEDEIG